jgi:uncharacterized membrane protein YfcA
MAAMDISNTQLAFVTLAFVLAGTVKGVTGMGLPTVAVGLLSLTMPPMEAAALLIVPSSLTNIWQLMSGPGVYLLWLRMRSMLLAGCLGTAVLGWWLWAQGGAGDPTLVNPAAARWSGGLLGLALAAYGLLGLSGWRARVAPRSERWLAPAAGFITGMLAGATGVFVMPAVPYLQSLDLDKDELVQAMGLAFTVSTLAVAVLLACQGVWRPAAAGASFLALLPASCGMLLGGWLRGRMSPLLFRRCFFIGLLALGAHQCVRALLG